MISRLALFFIRLYQATPTHLHSACRFQPTCSAYTYQAIQKYGILKGSFWGLRRILRCHPFTHPGPDPLT